MKTTKKFIFAAAAAMFASVAVAQVPPRPIEITTPGIVVAGSYDKAKLPKEAHEFIAKYFPGATVVKCEQYYAKGKVSVELNTGVDIDFDMKGNPVEVEAPDRAALPREVVKKLLHDTAFARLIADGYADKVESIEIKRGRVVEVSVDKRDPDTYIFDINGLFIALED
ncbi:MAG: PepSY-like domain-containing protein [Duncaniella sp.]|nr:PepSY-like domain-containing protein [Duncaniella sp.]